MMVLHLLFLLLIHPGALGFRWKIGTPLPPALPMVVINDDLPCQPPVISIEAPTRWLTVTQSVFDCTEKEIPLSVAVNPIGMAAGIYQANIMVNNVPVPVTLYVQ